MSPSFRKEKRTSREKTRNHDLAPRTAKDYKNAPLAPVREKKKPVLILPKKNREALKGTNRAAERVAHERSEELWGKRRRQGKNVSGAHAVRKRNARKGVRGQENRSSEGPKVEEKGGGKRGHHWNDQKQVSGERKANESKDTELTRKKRKGLQKE